MKKTAILALGLALATIPSPALAGTDDAKVVAALDTVAKPLTRDLDAFGAMVGDAQVVGVGEATHSTVEFYTLNQRLFRYLVTEKGFTTFARELSWSTGVRLNDYVLHGEGDPRAIFRDEVKGPYDLFDNQEFLNLVQWMRAYNTTHAHKVQFMGADLLYPGDLLFDKVLGYVKQHHPGLLGEFTKLYDGLRPTTKNAGEYMGMALAVPLKTRQDNAERATQALKLLQKHGADRWVVQHARALSQTFTDFAFDQATAEGRRQAAVYRDSVLAGNVAWWNKTTGDKIQISGLNAHLSYTPIDTTYVPAPMGGMLRKQLGDRFVTVGTTFERGGYNYTLTEGDCPKPAERPMTCKGSVEAAPSGYNEYVLDQVRYRDFILDTRTTPAAAKQWLAQERSTRVIGGGFWTPEQAFQASLGASFDVVIHFHSVKAAHLLP
ncbi:erythromycin esterase family protein (plasmid) [Actinomadura sp. ATCC 31491]|uniref:Erythromycin esterase family protein n=1 Tax=Actinomadura luzonensis TaxID=2805427 RepID=A0ABT0GBN0_9ACTN|nr:erythromycin esterase family protein [Actinomadura luzonensis]MCK2221997.1 erythromycin esterase family protein [Actinomadura luzonensis]